ncbi:MAG: 4-alpha-glucanotransferase [Thermostichales cyanobacterium SRBZ-1_bins_19]
MRASGILCHPTSFPGPFGIGDLGVAAYQFLDFLAQAGQRLWQVLPLGPTGYGYSPYMSYGALAGNPLLISPEKLVEQGWITSAQWHQLPDWDPLQRTWPGQVAFDLAARCKWQILQLAYAGFCQNATPQQREAFAHYQQTQSFWLDDFSLFMALLDHYQGQEWTRWDPPLSQRQPQALAEARRALAAGVELHQFAQWVFDQQWQDLKQVAQSYGIEIIGDIPIYVAFNSADVWAQRQYFQLDATGQPLFVAVVPPDYFSATGQRWGNPLYDWPALKQDNYRWWVQRFQRLLTWVDWVRLDHFRGFAGYWAVPAEEETAEHGSWQPGPGADFFQALQQQLGSLPILAEDLGEITPDVHQLREQFGFPGMKILEFAFGDDAGNPFLPHNYERNYVVYTGTHDNDTVVGWFYSERMDDWQREAIKRYLGGSLSPDGIQWDMIRLALASVCRWAIIPLQDVMGLGSDSRMNTPGTSENNWGWRYTAEMLHGGLSERLSSLSLTYGRIFWHELERMRRAVQERLHPPEPEPDPESDPPSEKMPKPVLS